MGRFAIILACVLAAGTLAGCSGEAEPGQTVKRPAYECAETQFTAPAAGDTIAVFRKGELVQCGAHEQLVHAKGEYKRLWDAQAGYYIDDRA